MGNKSGLITQVCVCVCVCVFPLSEEGVKMAWEARRPNNYTTSSLQASGPKKAAAGKQCIPWRARAGDSQPWFSNYRMRQNHLEDLLKYKFLNPTPGLAFLIHFYWSIVALQCCTSFYCTAKWISHTYTDIPSLLNWLPTLVTIVHWVPCAIQCVLISYLFSDAADWGGVWESECLTSSNDVDAALPGGSNPLG